MCVSVFVKCSLAALTARRRIQEKEKKIKDGKAKGRCVGSQSAYGLFSISQVSSQVRPSPALSPRERVPGVPCITNERPTAGPGSGRVSHGQCPATTPWRGSTKCRQTRHDIITLQCKGRGRAGARTRGILCFTFLQCMWEGGVVGEASPIGHVRIFIIVIVGLGRLVWSCPVSTQCVCVCVCTSS